MASWILESASQCLPGKKHVVVIEFVILRKTDSLKRSAWYTLPVIQVFNLFLKYFIVLFSIKFMPELVMIHSCVKLWQCEWCFMVDLLLLCSRMSRPASARWPAAEAWWGPGRWQALQSLRRAPVLLSGGAGTFPDTVCPCWPRYPRNSPVQQQEQTAQPGHQSLWQPGFDGHWLGGGCTLPYLISGHKQWISCGVSSSAQVISTIHPLSNWVVPSISVFIYKVYLSVLKFPLNNPFSFNVIMKRQIQSHYI